MSKKNQSAWLWLLLGGGALLLASKASGQTTSEIEAVKNKSKSGKRGLDNNNPGNIRTTPGLTYNGEILPSTDPAFKQFKSRAYGYRAMFVLLRAYLRNGFDTIAKVISRYAPSSENPTEIYISFISKATGIDRSKILSYDQPADMIALVKAISAFENGVKAVDQEVQDGYNLFAPGV
jgi:hypothetical protein